MKHLRLLALLFLTGCTVQLKDERIDAAKLDAVLKEQSAVIVAVVEQLQAKGYLEKPKEEK